MIAKITKSIVLTAILGGLVMANAAETANLAKSENSQELVKFGSLGSSKGDSKIFTGEVRVTRMFGSADFRPFGGALVEFSAGARSAWHTHPAGQTLIVTEGVIITATEEGVVQIAHKGDTILCPPNLRHFHGATDKQSGSHIALTGVKDGKNVVWLEKVSDKEYKETLKKAFK